MNDRQLRSFIKAADLKSFSRAAESSFISPSALIQQINLLEKDLGFPLFNRGFHGITLTPSGEAFYKAALDIIERYDQAIEEGKHLLLSAQAPLRIACPYESFPDFLMQSFQEYTRRYPDAKAEFLHVPFHQQFDQIRSGNADISFSAQPADSFIGELFFENLCDDTYSFVMSPQHPLSHENKIEPQMLRHYRVICGSYSYLKVPFAQRLAEYQIETTALDKSYGIDTRLKTLSSTDIFVIHSLWEHPYEDMLRVVPSDIPSGKIGVLSAQKRSPAADAFISICKEILSINSNL